MRNLITVCQKTSSGTYIYALKFNKF